MKTHLYRTHPTATSQENESGAILVASFSSTDLVVPRFRMPPASPARFSRFLGDKDSAGLHAPNAWE